MEQSERCDFLSFLFLFMHSVSSVKGRNFTRAYLSIVKKLASSSFFFLMFKNSHFC